MATRKKFSAEFKSQVVLAALAGRMSVGEIASEYGVSKTMVYKWKGEATRNMPSLFGGKRECAQRDKEMDALKRKIGELTLELDFVKRASKALGDSEARKRLVSSSGALSLNRQLALLGISKGAYYYISAPAPADEAEPGAVIDKEHLVHPAKGVRQMCVYLRTLGFAIGVKRTRRLMRSMAIEPCYAKPNLSRRGRAKYVKPYLLRGMTIDHANQVWCTDITYIAMPGGHQYLYAIIDVYSRAIVGWGLYSTLQASGAVEVLERAVEEYGTPEIVNSDQGSQYTCPSWEEALKRHGITISMDGRGRCRNNTWIERFWRTIKTEYVYLDPCDDTTQTRDGIKAYINYYNMERYHSGIGCIPMSRYQREIKTAA